jgi:transposase
MTTTKPKFKESARLRRVRQGNHAGQEERRMRAAELFEQGWNRLQVARELGVCHKSASRWYDAWLQGGVDALKSAGATGPNRKLDAVQAELVLRVLLRGAVTYGYKTNLWTLSRIAHVIESETGVHYHPSTVWRVLRQLKWTHQRPARRAKERDDLAIGAWRQEVWPLVKKGL